MPYNVIPVPANIAWHATHVKTIITRVINLSITAASSYQAFARDEMHAYVVDQIEYY